ncbi:MAG: chemotaxis protein CheA [Anaerolineae bacterium]|nr:MAG: chemotaxis protein CheA [Anaerolineae bacterium]
MNTRFDITEEELPIFRAEAEDQLQILEEGLVQLERKSQDQELVQALFRAAHTLKGSAGMIGHKRMVELTHALETVLDGVRKQALEPSSELIDVMLESLDSLHQLLDEVGSEELSSINVHSIIAQLQQLSGVQSGSASSIQKPASIASQPSEKAQSTNQADQTSQPLTIQVKISQESIASAARALQVVFALQEMGHILELNPPLSVIESATPVAWLTVMFRPTKPLYEIRKSLSMISELEEILIEGEQLKSETLETKPVQVESRPAPQAKYSLGELLVQNGLITEEQLQTALRIQRESEGPSKPLGQILVGMGWVSQEVLDEIIAEQSAQKKAPAMVSAEADTTDKGRTKVIDKTVRTSVERLDNLMNLIGELITDRNRMYQLRRELEALYRGSPQVEALSDTIIHVGRITDMLQSEVMSIRMLPISNVFNKFPRLVRDLARKANKQIDLVIRGEDTELDRSVLEVISDPLIHLIRNAVDHGIEFPEERRAAGKPERGIILLTARHEQGRIYITVEDDGRGIDVNRVKAKAVEKGQITQAEADAMSEDEAIELIFVSGLSTARTVSDVSGRGVGMDIVRANIEQLNGNIQVETWLGKGTQFTIILPLTLAIVPTLLVKVCGSTYAIPLVTVNETLRIKAKDIQTVNGRPVISLREHVLPVCNLGEVFALQSRDHGRTKNDYEYIVVVRSGKSQLGLIVDDLIGEEEVVVKSLSSVIGEVIGISNAAILGDGQVALVIDVQGLIKLVTSWSERSGRFERLPD